MKAILIDANNREIKEVEISKDYRDINRHIGCNIFTYALTLDRGDAIMVDDEGLINNTNTFFYYDGAHQPFAGNGLIVGSDEEGETTDCKINIDNIKNKVKFYSGFELAIAMNYGQLNFN